MHNLEIKNPPLEHNNIDGLIHIVLTFTTNFNPVGNKSTINPVVSYLLPFENLHFSELLPLRQFGIIILVAVVLLLTFCILIMGASNRDPEKRQIVRPRDRVSPDSQKPHPPVPVTIPLIDQNFPTEIFWTNVILCIIVHVAGLYGVYLSFLGKVKWQSWIWNTCFYFFNAMGTAAGAHRYWSHKSFKAKLPLRLLLATMQTFSFQYSIYDWSRTHRVHHKYAETNADPHNIKRGFFFAHIGWLLCREHPAVIQKLGEVDSSDLEADSIVMFQKRYYWPLVVLCICLMPLPLIYGWGESLETGFFFGATAIFCFSLNITGCINSAAHYWGDRPFEKRFGATDNPLLVVITGGEGNHNYHHAFPWDYKTREFGSHHYGVTAFLDFMARIGWAYDLKTVSKEIVMARVERTGDGSHYSISKKQPSYPELWFIPTLITGFIIAISNYSWFLAQIEKLSGL